jgi:hypothetical protein
MQQNQSQMQQRSSPALAPQPYRSPALSPQHVADKAQRVYKEFLDDNNQPVRLVANDPYVCTSTPEVTPQHRAQNPCKHFLQGHCNRGTACRFHHPDVELTVALHMGTPRRSPPLGPKAVSPSGVTDDGPEPPAMALPPAAVSPPSGVLHTHDPYQVSPKQKFPAEERQCESLSAPAVIGGTSRETTPIFSDGMPPRAGYSLDHAVSDHDS